MGPWERSGALETSSDVGGARGAPEQRPRELGWRGLIFPAGGPGLCEQLSVSLAEASPQAAGLAWTRDGRDPLPRSPPCSLGDLAAHGRPRGPLRGAAHGKAVTG